MREGARTFEAVGNENQDGQNIGHHYRDIRRNVDRP